MKNGENGMYGLEGKVAVVSGAATGIGRAIAVRLAREGCDLGILDVNEEGAKQTAALVERAGRRCHVALTDVSDYQQVRESTDRLLEVFGRIDLLYNNAGIIRIATLAETSPADFRDIFRINVDGVFHCCKAVVPHMMERRSGKIVNTASWFGKIGHAGYGAYCASKFAVIGLTQSLAREVASHRINVNAVCPGTIVDTCMREEADRESVLQGLATAKEREGNIPWGRVGLPEDIARVAVFLASDEAEYMTGQAINVTGGLWMQ
jgi:NAD(P)-dependent dehydrogenase (short-subunit alcohol dehydrogenase family)